MAWQALEGIIRDPVLGAKPEANELRLQLVKMYALMERFPDAIAHVDYLLEQSPKDKKEVEELHVLKAAYLGGLGKFDDAIKDYYKLVGYDPQAETFDAEKAIAPHNIPVYTDLARLIRTRRDDTELANRIIDQMVEVNPDSAEAHLARGQYLNSSGDDDRCGASRHRKGLPAQAGRCGRAAEHRDSNGPAGGECPRGRSECSIRQSKRVSHHRQEAVSR